MPISVGGERFIRGYQDPDSKVEVGLKLEGVPEDKSGQFGKQTVADQKDYFACRVIEEPAYNAARSLRAGGTTYDVSMQFVTQLSPSQEKAINDKNVLKKLTYAEAVKLSGTDKHQIYYQIEIDGIQNASAQNGVLLVREAESVQVKYQMAQGEGKLAAQEVIALTPAAAS